MIKEYYKSSIGLEEKEYYLDVFNTFEAKLRFDYLEIKNMIVKSKRNYDNIFRMIEIFKNLLIEQIDHGRFLVNNNRREVEIYFRFLSIFIALLTLIAGIIYF